MSEAVTTTALAESNPTPPTPPSYVSPAERWAARSSPAASPAALSRDGVIADREYDALPDDRRAAYARVKKLGADGGSEWIERAKLPADLTTTPKPATNGAAPTVTADGRLQVGDMLLTPQDIQTLMAEKAQSDLRKTQIPSSAENYQPKLPEGFALPAGTRVRRKLAAVSRCAKMGARERAFSEPIFRNALVLR
jgi:hypothetical protein